MRHDYTPSAGTGLNTVSNCSNANINGNTFVSGYFAISLPTCVPTTMAGNSFRGNTPGWIASALPTPVTRTSAATQPA